MAQGCSAVGGEAVSRISLDRVGHAYFGRTVLDAVSMRIEAGECVALLGPSGSGKTTLLQIASGLVTPLRGQVKRRYRRHAMVFQDPRLLPWATAADNIGFGLRQRGVRRAERDARIADVARLVDLDHDDLEKYPVELSGGMRQRVAIARALAVEPDFVFLDEPFSALDVGLRRRLQQLVLERLLGHRAGLFFVTHDLVEAVQIAHRILVLSADGSGLAGERQPDGIPLQRDARSAFDLAETYLATDPLFADLNNVENRRAV